MKCSLMTPICKYYSMACCSLISLGCCVQCVVNLASVCGYLCADWPGPFGPTPTQFFHLSPFQNYLMSMFTPLSLKAVIVYVILQHLRTAIAIPWEVTMQEVASSTMGSTLNRKLWCWTKYFIGIYLHPPWTKLWADVFPCPAAAH